MGRTREFLTDRERRLLESKEELDRMTPQRRRDFFKDLRRKATDMIEALTVLTEYLPEKQQTQVFTREVFDPLVCNTILLGKDLKAKPRTDRHYQLASLFAICGLNVCQEKIQKLNPTAWTAVVEDFNRTRQFVLFSIPEEDKRPLVTLVCPNRKCGNRFETRIDPRAPIVRCPKCGQKFKV